jgi:hypothetical protein
LSPFSAGTDYVFTSVAIPFIGNQTYLVNVSIIADQRVEANETFLGQLRIDSPHPNMILRNSIAEMVISITEEGERNF